MRRNSWIARLLLACLVVSALAVPWAGVAPAAEAEKSHASRHVIVISIDGLMPAAYLHPEKYNLKIPNLKRLMADGSYSAGVQVVYPSLTYPTHSTLVTGVGPAVHGIYANEIFTDPTRGQSVFFWEAKALRVPTLWDAAREAGLKTAAVGWPATVGAAIDYHLPEYFDPDKHGSGADFHFAERFATPGLVDALEREFGPSTNKPLDEARTDAAVYILREYAPHLLLLHIYDLDTAQHDFGPMSPPALEKIEFADRQVGRLIEAARQRGILAETTFVVVSDHGFLSIQQDINLGRLLSDAGLLHRTKAGRIDRWKVAPLITGGSAYLFLHQPAGQRDVAKLYGALEPYVRSGAIAAIWSLAMTKELTGVDGAMMLEAGNGYSFREGWFRPAVIEAAQKRGRHGYLPFRPGLEASFVAAGAGIRRGVRLPVIRMTAIGPTVAALLGTVLPAADPVSVLSAILDK